jgi:hypothetical protein
LTKLKNIFGRSIRMQPMETSELPGEPATPNTDEVVRMMYASRANIQSSVYAEMERIRASAVRNNTPKGVYTALLYQSGWFLQWKECPGRALLETMERVARDPRHHSLRLVHSSRGARLLSGPWSMAIVLDKQPSESRWLELHREMERGIDNCVAQLHQGVKRGVQHAPPAIWRRLSMPARWPGSDVIDDAMLQSILVCSASGRQPFELVDWLAARHEQEVVHRRYADDQRPDVGTDYVDCPRPTGVLRVTAMARNGLGVPLTRALLTDHSHVVMLLDADPGPDQRLMDRVGQALAGFSAAPALLGVAGGGAAHEEMARLAANWGLRYEAVPAVELQDHGALWGAIEPQLATWQRPHAAWPVDPLFANSPLGSAACDGSPPGGPS